MANCYRCGRPILDTKVKLRRKVQTGGFERRKFPGSSVASVQTHYGMRIVCTRCAYIIDLQSGRKMNAENAYILTALVFLVLLLLFARLFGY